MQIDKKVPAFQTTWRDHRLSYLIMPRRGRPPGTREEPILVRLDVAAGHTPNGKPPVRIFVGTESAQHRAERVFVWSVMQARDPARVYEIYFMKDLAGFDRRSWKTGFTHYRYAIPKLAGGHGRAIYNDVDQIYFADPAELFDLDMDGAGVMCVNRRDTSVMLLDCEKMLRIWGRDLERSRFKHKYFRARMLAENAWRQLPGEWNAREFEYDPDRSKLLHYTTLQTQPWRPFPEQLKYHDNENGKVWHEMEWAANAAHFTLFTKERPSKRYAELLEQYRLMHEHGESNLRMSADDTFDGHSLGRHVEAIGQLVAETGARTILDFGAGKGQLYSPYPGKSPEDRLKTMPAWGEVTVTCYDPAHAPFAGPYEAKYDGVICTDVLEHIPEEDIGWVLEELFSHATKFVYAVAACYPAQKTLPNGENAHCTLSTPEWWKGQLDLAGRCHPTVRWCLATEDKTMLVRRRRYFRSAAGGHASAA